MDSNDTARAWSRKAWSLFGLEHALRAQGKTRSVDRVATEFDTAWEHADVELDLRWF